MSNRAKMLIRLGIGIAFLIAAIIVATYKG